MFDISCGWYFICNVLMNSSLGFYNFWLSFDWNQYKMLDVFYRQLTSPVVSFSIFFLYFRNIYFKEHWITFFYSFFYSVFLQKIKCPVLVSYKPKWVLFNSFLKNCAYVKMKVWRQHLFNYLLCTILQKYSRDCSEVLSKVVACQHGIC